MITYFSPPPARSRPSLRVHSLHSFVAGCRCSLRHLSCCSRTAQTAVTWLLPAARLQPSPGPDVTPEAWHPTTRSRPNRCLQSPLPRPGSQRARRRPFHRACPDPWLPQSSVDGRNGHVPLGPPTRLRVHGVATATTCLLQVASAHSSYCSSAWLLAPDSWIPQPLAGDRSGSMPLSAPAW